MLFRSLIDFSRAIEYLVVSPVNYHLFLKTSEVYYDRMISSLELGHFDQAFSDCEVVTRTDRMFQGGECYIKCTRILYRMRQYEQAQRFLSKVDNKTREYYELHMLICCMLGKYRDALSSYRVYERESMRTTNNNAMATTTAATTATTTMPMNQNLLIDIGIVLFMSDCLSECVDKFCEHIVNKFEYVFTTNDLTLRNIARAKELVLAAAMRQVNEQSSMISNATSAADMTSSYDQGESEFNNGQQSSLSAVHVAATDIHMAWSFYYFTLGMLYFLQNSSAVGNINSSTTTTNNNMLEEAMKSFTTCITLNPTLSESFYYRSLIQCYILLNMPLDRKSVV